MLRVITSIIIVYCFASCSNSQNSNSKGEIDLTIENKNDLDFKDSTKKNICVFNFPDTSISNIILRNSWSTAQVLGENEKRDEHDQYHYYSSKNEESLSLTQHAGDGKYQISIFKVEYSDKVDHGYPKLNIDTFRTEKGIKLGLMKRQIIERLGSCYVAKDSTRDYIELYYMLETPCDSQTKILERNNMPIYYASYKLWNDKLRVFEFGFEYP